MKRTHPLLVLLNLVFWQNQEWGTLSCPFKQLIFPLINLIVLLDSWLSEQPYWRGSGSIEMTIEGASLWTVTGLRWLKDQSCWGIRDVAMIVISFIGYNQHHWVVHSSLYMFPCGAASYAATLIIAPEIAQRNGVRGNSGLS